MAKANKQAKPAVASDHEEKETLVIDVTLPGHDERATTPLFTESRERLLARERGRSFVTGKNEQEAGGPLEAHHFFIERCLANDVDWKEFREYIDRLYALVGRAKVFCDDNPNLADIMTFVDDMTVNGMLIEKALHTGKGISIHGAPFPLWQLNCYGKEGVQFSAGDVIYHEDEAVAGGEMPTG